MLKMKSVVAAAALMAAPALALADGLSFSGHADFSIQDNNRDTNVSVPGYGADDSFTVNQVVLTATKAPVDGFGGVIQLAAGEDVAAGGFDGFSGAEVIQGYFQYTDGGLTITAGKFFTLAGYEVFASTGNNNISRSLLFAIQPFSHTGVRASFAVSDALTLTGGVINTAINGNDPQDTNEQKTIELSAALTPAKGSSIIVTGYFGNETPTSEKASIIDVVANFALSDAFTLGANLDLRKDELGATETKRTGLAVYGSLGLGEKSKLSLRAEQLKTEVTGGGEVKPTEVTVTFGHAVSKNFDLLAEVRLDDADALVFAGGTEEKARSAALKGIFKF